MAAGAETREGVAFPRVDGTRSTSAAGRAVFAAAAATVDTELAARIEREQRWHRGYLQHLRALVAADLRSSGRGEQLPRAGLELLRTRLRFLREGDEVALSDAFDLPGGAMPDLRTVAGTATAQPRPSLQVPYLGRTLEGSELRFQLDRWVAAGTVEPSFATAIGAVIDQPEWLDLRGHTIVLLGAGAEMGPLEALTRWGATVVPIDLPVPTSWEQLLATLRSGAGRALVPVDAERSAITDLARAAGVDLSTGFPEVARRLEQLEGPLTIGMYAYADGAAHVAVTMAADAIVAHLLERRDDVTLACLLTPTDVYAAPSDAVTEAHERWARRGPLHRTAHRLTGRRALSPNYPTTVTAADGTRYGLADCLVAQQGPNYALAKRAQRWRIRLARHDGVRVSANIAPATRTRSVTNNRVLAAAYAGAARYDVEIFDPETSKVLAAALLARDLSDPEAAGDPSTPLAHPLDLFADAAAHGGLWRQAYAPRSVLPAAAVRGSVRARRR